MRFFVSKTKKGLDTLSFSYSLVIMQSLYEKVWKGWVQKGLGSLQVNRRQGDFPEFHL